MKKSSAIKKAQMGAAIPGSKNGKPAPPKFKKSSPIPAGVPMPKGPKAKYGKTMKAQDGASKKKYDYFWQDPESTYSKRNEEARQNSKMRFLTDQILPQDKVQKFGKFEGYKYYDNANSESPKLLNDAARLAKKPNVTKAATPSLSKKDIKTYKKTGAAPKAKQGAVVKKKAVIRKPKK